MRTGHRELHATLHAANGLMPYQPPANGCAQRADTGFPDAIIRPADIEGVLPHRPEILVVTMQLAIRRGQHVPVVGLAVVGGQHGPSDDPPIPLHSETRGGSGAAYVATQGFAV